MQITNIEAHPLWDTQIAIEERMRSEGVDAFHKALADYRGRGEGADIGGAHEIIRRLIQPAAAGIREFMARAEAAGRGRKHIAYKMCKDTQSETLAFLALRCTLNALVFRGQGRSLQVVSKGIAEAVESEAKVAAFKTAHPDRYRWVMRDLDARTSHKRHRRNVLGHAMNDLGFTVPAWTTTEKYHVGSALFELTNEATGLFKVIQPNRMDTIRVTLTAEAVEMVERLDSLRAMLAPNLMPCVIPPKPWAEGMSGGYWSEVLWGDRPTPLVRRAKQPKDLSGTVYESLNAVQDTAWKINAPVLDVLRSLLDGLGNGLGVVPSMEDQPLPEKPVDIDTNEEARRSWRRAAAKVYESNVSLRSKRLQVLKVLSVAEEFGQYERIYFPHNLDFRGRMYALPRWLSPQGPDYARALLTFADGAAIEDDEAAGWLAIHGANQWGEDKVTLADRIDWAFANTDRIHAVAEDPLSNLWWAEADEPMCFLAWCLEWSAFMREGFGFVSSLPIGMDGTCNGLQHFSAMLRDPVGGGAVNLTPSEQPKDIYQAVADRVKARLAEEANNIPEPEGGWAMRPSDEQMLANKWLQTNLVDRKVTKRPVMVLPYGGQFTSCREYVEEAVRDAWAGGKANPFSMEEERDAILYLAHVVWDSIGDVVVAAKDAMAWLRTVAQVCGKAGVDEIAWTTPVGFKAAQAYKSTVDRRIATALNGKIIRMIAKEETDKLDKRKQGQAMSPNFVHSMDASALMLTIELGVENGITSFSMIHDCYGTTAAHAAKLAACTRHAFVEMYEDHDVLAELREGLVAKFPELDHELPAAPAKGTLDIRLVLESDFFFC